MSNPLGNLFSRIANSIRGGLGEIGTMKPNDFPERIDEIVSLIGSSSGGNEIQIKHSYGQFKPTASRQLKTIEHGLGGMPDIVILFTYTGIDTAVGASENSPITSAWAVHSKFGLTYNAGLSMTVLGSRTSYGLDNMPSGTAGAGHIRCTNETTFTVGRNASSGAIGLSPKITYYWVAIKITNL